LVQCLVQCKISEVHTVEDTLQCLVQCLVQCKISEVHTVEDRLQCLVQCLVQLKVKHEIFVLLFFQMKNNKTIIHK